VALGDSIEVCRIQLTGAPRIAAGSEHDSIARMSAQPGLRIGVAPLDEGFDGIGVLQRLVLPVIFFVLGTAALNFELGNGALPGGMIVPISAFERPCGGCLLCFRPRTSSKPSPKSRRLR
jgi:hypothetical protein